MQKTGHEIKIYIFVRPSLFDPGQFQFTRSGNHRERRGFCPDKSYALSNKQSEYINGWRIQIIATTDRLALENTKIKFQQSYPDIPFKLYITGLITI